MGNAVTGMTPVIYGFALGTGLASGLGRIELGRNGLATLPKCLVY